MFFNFLFNSKFQFSLVLRLVLQTETEKLGGLIVFPSLFFFSFFSFFFFTFSVEVLLLFSLLMVYLFIFWFYLFLLLQATHSKMSRLAFTAGCIEVNMQLHRRSLITFDYSPS